YFACQAASGWLGRERRLPVAFRERRAGAPRAPPSRRFQMTTVRHPPAAGAMPHGGDASGAADHHGRPHGWRRWVWAANHKDIGTLYLVFSTTMLLMGGVLAMGIRAELFQPG